MSRKSVTIHYRRLSDVTGAFDGETLEQSVRRAMAYRVGNGTLSDNWHERTYSSPPETDSIIFTNIHHDGQTSYFGDLTSYSVDFLQALLHESSNTPTVDVEQQPAPQGMEYIQSIMYWMIRRNHAFVIQSASLKAQHLETYLTWLLKDKTQTIRQDGQVILQAKFDAEDIGGDLEDIRKIIVGGTETVLSATDTSQIEHEATVDSYRAVDERRTWADKAKAVLNAIMNNQADVDRLLDSIPDEASLQVSVHIGYKTRRRRITRAPMQHALRNLPEGEVTAIGKTGKVTGNDVRLSCPASILMQGSLLDIDDVIRAFEGAYTFFVENGKIEP